MSGPDAIDGSGWKLALPKPARTTLRGLRVAVLATHPTAETDATVQQAIGRLAQFLAKQGAKVSERALPAFDLGEAHRVFIQLLRGATSARQTPEYFAQMLAAKDKLDPNDGSYYGADGPRQRQPHKGLARGVQPPAPDAPRLGGVLPRLGRAAVSQRGDRGVPAFAAGRALGAHDHRDGRPQRATTQMWWAGISGMCLLPGTAAPIGLSPEGLPIGVQIVGPQYGDLTTIRVAQLIEREYYAFVPPPAYA